MDEDEAARQFPGESDAERSAWLALNSITLTVVTRGDLATWSGPITQWLQQARAVLTNVAGDHEFHAATFPARGTEADILPETLDVWRRLEQGLAGREFGQVGIGSGSDFAHAANESISPWPGNYGHLEFNIQAAATRLDLKAPATTERLVDLCKLAVEASPAVTASIRWTPTRDPRLEPAEFGPWDPFDWETRILGATWGLVLGPGHLDELEAHGRGLDSPPCAHVEPLSRGRTLLQLTDSLMTWEDAGFARFASYLSPIIPYRDTRTSDEF